MAVDFSTNNYFLKDLIPISTFPITISFWLKADSIPASGKWCHLVSRTKTDIIYVKNWNYGVIFVYSSSTLGDIGMGYGDGINNRYKVFTTVDLSLNTWYFIVAVFWTDGETGAPRFWLYVNDTLYTYNGTVLTTLTTPMENRIGGIGDTSSFDGKMNEIAIWNAQLTDNEIYQLRRAFKRRFPLQIQPTLLKAYYPLDDWGASGLTATGAAQDLSGNAKHIDVVGSPVGISDNLSYRSKIIVV